MSGKSKIEWTNATWNPIAGCSLVSPGCTNCYAMRLAHRLSHVGGKTQAKYAGLTEVVNGNPVWNGMVRLADERTLTAPLRWRKPRRIFVNSMSDLFHEDVPDEWIDQVSAVISACPQHSFQVLTKRPERMCAYWSDPDTPARIEAFQWALIENEVDPLARRSDDIRATTLDTDEPLPNVWLITSVEDQRRANKRIPWILKTPAAVRGLSCEPLLGPIDLTRLDLGIKRTHGYGNRRVYWDALTGWEHQCAPSKHLTAGEHGRTSISGPGRRVQWVIVGGESGPGARPMHPEWARSIRDQCQAAGVAFFFKQWGEWGPEYNGREGTPCGPPGLEDMYRVGRKAAGRKLDGRTWDEYPDG